MSEQALVVQKTLASVSHLKFFAFMGI